MRTLSVADALRALIDAVENQVQRDGVTPMPTSRAVKQALVDAKRALMEHPDGGSVADILRGLCR